MIRLISAIAVGYVAGRVLEEGLTYGGTWLVRRIVRAVVARVVSLAKREAPKHEVPYEAPPR